MILSKDNESGIPLISKAVLDLDVVGDNSFIFLDDVDADDEKLPT